MSEKVYDFVESAWYPVDLDMRETLYRLYVKNITMPDIPADKKYIKGLIYSLSNEEVLNIYKKFTNGEIPEIEILLYCSKSKKATLTPGKEYKPYKDIMNALLPHEITLVDLVNSRLPTPPAAAAAAASSSKGGSTSDSYKNILIDEIVEWISDNYSSLPSTYGQYLETRTVDELIDIITRINKDMFDISEIYWMK